MSSVTKNLVTSSPVRISARAFWALLEQLAWPITLLASVPLLMSALNVADFGVFSLALTVCGMSSLLSIGIGTITLRNVAVSEETGNRHEALLAVRRALGSLIVCGGILIALLAALSPTLAGVVFLGMGRSELTTQALWAGLCCALFQEIDAVFSMAIKGLGRFRLAALVEWIGRIVWISVAAISASYWGLLAAMIATVFAMAVKCIVKAFAASLVFGSGHTLVPLISIVALRNLLSASRWLWIQNLSGLILLSADRLVVGALFGPVTLAHYTACAQLSQFVFVIPATMGQALLPWMARHLGGQTEPVAGWGKTLFSLGLLSSVGGLLMVFGARPILTFWLGRDFASENTELLVALAFGGMLLAFSVPFHYLHLALGNVRMIGLANGLGAAICAGLWFLTSPSSLLTFSLVKALYSAPLLIYGFMLPSKRSPIFRRSPLI